MRTRTIVILATLATLLVGPALAAIPGPALLSDPLSPTTNRYLRVDDNWWVQWDAAARTVTPLGPAATGVLLGETVNCSANNAWCNADSDGTHEDPECVWFEGDPFRDNPSQGDFRGGRCAELRVKADGQDAFIQFRPASRVAALTALSEDVTAEWGYRLVILWYSGNSQLPIQGPPDARTNPTTVDLTLEGCTVDPDDQNAALQGAHWFMDCVWSHSAILNAETLIPTQNFNGNPNGFLVQAHLVQKGNALPENSWSASILCRSCFTR